LAIGDCGLSIHELPTGDWRLAIADWRLPIGAIDDSIGDPRIGNPIVNPSIGNPIADRQSAIGNR
jgi:hypothetical protein